MFKLMVLSALLAIAAGNHATPIVETPVETPVITAKVGEIVENVPTGVSHQSSTVVHSRAAVSTPVVAEVATSPVVYSSAPVVRSYVAASSPLSYTAQSVPFAYSAPVAYSAPTVVSKVVSEPANVKYVENVAYGPSIRYLASPYAYSAYSAPVVHTW